MVIRNGFVNICGSNKEFTSIFCVGSRVRYDIPEEGRRTYRPKRCGYSNKDKINSPNILSNNNFMKLAINEDFKNFIVSSSDDMCNPLELHKVFYTANITLHNEIRVWLSILQSLFTNRITITLGKSIQTPNYVWWSAPTWALKSSIMDSLSACWVLEVTACNWS